MALFALLFVADEIRTRHADAGGKTAPRQRQTVAPMIFNEIFIVDDDYDIREALSTLFQREGYRVAAFRDGTSFVRMTRGQTPACVLLDLCMPGPSGLDVLRELDARTFPAPILIVSGQEDIGDVVRAMRFGAFDYIAKRLEADAIVARAVEAIDQWTQLRRREEASPPLSPAIPGYYQLTPREREVLLQIADAASNKETARNLGISPRTVEIHRGRIMHKLGAKNSVDLMRIIMKKEPRRERTSEAAQPQGADTVD
jgi:two-component system, LuxR family, response regulator FixJ